MLHPACLLRLEGLKVSLAGENPNRNPSCFVSELWEARLGAMASSTPISGPRWWGWSFSLALFGALLACGLLTMVPNLGASTSVPRRLAQGTKSADELSASAAEEGGEDGENDKEPFWQQALEGLVEEGAEIAKQDAMGTGPVATSATNASCEDRLSRDVQVFRVGLAAQHDARRSLGLQTFSNIASSYVRGASAERQLRGRILQRLRFRGEHHEVLLRHHGSWALVYGFILSYHHKETILLAIDPYYGTLK